jgi:broad specificity phosphatase PhoE
MRTKQEKDEQQLIHLVDSLFERTKQTAAIAQSQFEDMIFLTDIDRIQEVRNLENHETFGSYRNEQERIGRFITLFPTRESGADVLDRVKELRYKIVLTVNLRWGYVLVNKIVGVTHGLTMRFILKTKELRTTGIPK